MGIGPVVTLILVTFQLVVMIVVRKLLDYVFSQRELKILDDIMPEGTKRKEEEELRMKDDFLDTDVSISYYAN